MTIAVTADFYAIRVHIDDVLHVRIDRSKLLAVHSWFDHAASFSIEYVFKGGNLVTEYTTHERWACILKGLETIL